MEFKIKLLDKRQEARDTKTFIFERPKNFLYLAGQYVYLTLPKLDQPDERGDTRHFTLSSSPTELDLAITVRMRAESGYKGTLDSYLAGTAISMRGPNGFFTLDNEKTTIQQIMIAGGIGVTPFRSIIKYIADKKLSVPVCLLCSNSIPEEVVFGKELDRIAEERRNIKVIYTVTHPEESRIEWGGLAGRIDKKMLTKMINRFVAGAINGRGKMENLVFWLCGPPSMVVSLEEVLAQMGVSQSRIKTEKFTGY